MDSNPLLQEVNRILSRQSSRHTSRPPSRGEEREGKIPEGERKEKESEDRNKEERDEIEQPDPEIKAFALSHPLGALLINMQAKSMELEQRMGLTPNPGELKQLCENFYTAIQLERQTTQDNLSEQVALSTNQLESQLLSKEFNYSHINQTVIPPVKFSATPVLTSSHKLSEALKLFPMSKPSMKFSGAPGSSVTIIEFLQSLKQAQDILNLMESEFYDCMLRSCTGRAYALVENYIDHNYKLEDIFSSLILLFDHRLTPLEAKKILSNFKAQKHSNLTKLEGTIMSLATRVASSLPKGPSRTALYDLEASTALLNCLPPTSTVLVRNLYNSLTSRLGKHPSFCELTRSLTRFHDTISEDIAYFGATSSRNSGDRRMNNMANHSTNMISQGSSNGRGPNQHGQQGNASNKGYARGHASGSGHARINALNADNSRDKRENNMRNTPPKNSRDFSGQNQTENRDRTDVPPQNQNKGHSYCTLCGRTGHQASDGCFAMKNDAGECQMVIPTFDPCNLCEERLGKRLFHPLSYCISRDSYPRFNAGGR